MGISVFSDFWGGARRCYWDRAAGDEQKRGGKWKYQSCWSEKNLVKRRPGSFGKAHTET